MNEIRMLRLIVNNTPHFAKYAVEANNFPVNGAQIIQTAAAQNVVDKVTKVYQPEKSAETEKDKSRKSKEEKARGKYSVSKDNIINLHI